MDISIADILKGNDYHIEYEVEEMCNKCNGVGGKEKNKCSVCKGTGNIISPRNINGVFFTDLKTCMKCNGFGELLVDKCMPCNGVGYNAIKKSLNFEIKKK